MSLRTRKKDFFFSWSERRGNWPTGDKNVSMYVLHTVGGAAARAVLHQLRVAQHDAVAAQQRRRARLQRLRAVLQAARHQPAARHAQGRHPDAQAQAQEVRRQQAARAARQEGRPLLAHRRRSVPSVSTSAIDPAPTASLSAHRERGGSLLKSSLRIRHAIQNRAPTPFLSYNSVSS